jgi:segregation and condensation protein B
MIRPVAQTPDKPVSANADPKAEGRFSLDRLSAAFARLTGTASPEPTETTAAQVSESLDEIQAAKSVADRQVLSPRMIVEGMLFVGHADGRALTNRSMASHIRDVSPQEVDALIAELNEIYDSTRCCYTIVSEGAGYRLQLRPEHEPLRQRLSGRAKQVKLTPQAIEVLSVVAYRQPVSADDVTRVRGSRSDALLSQLIRRGLLQLERPGEMPAPVYRTTDRFNRLLNIKSPAELPQSEDLDDN